MMNTSPFLALMALLFYPLMSIASPWHDPAACNSAETILCGTVLNNETNQNYPNKLDNYRCGAADIATGYKGAERIYRLAVNTTQNYQFILDDIRNDDVNFDIFLMEGSCEAGNCIASGTNSRNSREQMDALLTPGIYYLVVDTWDGEVGTFDLSVTCTTPPPPPSCATTLWLKCDQRMSSTTRFADNNYDADDYNCISGSDSYDGPDEIWEFQKSHSRDNIQLHLFTDNPNLNIILVNQCDRNGFKCILSGEDFAGGKYISEGNYGLPAGQYYVIVDGLGAGDIGDYELQLTCGTMDVPAMPLECGVPMTNQDLGEEDNNWAIYDCGRKQGQRKALTGPDKVYDFVIEERAEITVTVSNVQHLSEIEVFLFEEGLIMPQCIAIGDKSIRDITITRVLEPGRYMVGVDGMRAGTYDITLSGCPCRADAELICDTPITDSNIGAGNSVGQISGGCTARSINVGAQDRIYSFTAPESKNYTFLLYDIGRDLDLFILSDCSESGNCMGSSRRTGNDRVTVALDAGETVYALVDGSSRLVETDFTIRVSCLEDLDEDGIEDDVDNCPEIPNADQANNDGDAEGDVCDDDDDNDGVLDAVDCDPFDATINYSIGDACNDNNAGTFNDTINQNCLCVGTPDGDRDGVADAVDDCPNTPPGAVVNAQGCSDADGDGFFPGAVGARFDPDDNDKCNPDDSSAECQPMASRIQLSIPDSKGALGDTVCFDISATDFTGVSAASFSINIDPAIAKILSITNISLAGGTFTGSGSAMTGSGSGMTGSGSMTGSGTNGFVIWTADGGDALTLGLITPIVEVCAEIISNDFDSATVSIVNDPVRIEFLDARADTIPYIAGTGTICRDTTAPAMAMIAGAIVDIAGRSLPDVEVKLTGDMSDVSMTDGSGAYALAVRIGGDYSVVPTMTPAPMEQVSLLDVLMLRKHLIFRESLTEAYQYVAADIDGSGHISVRDELLMKMMILGLDEGRYPYWRFVKSEHEFDEVAAFTLQGEVFDYPSFTSVNVLEGDMNQDFIGIRMGDLEMEDLGASSRSIDKLIGSITDKYIAKGEELTIPISLNQSADVLAMHFNAKLDKSALEVTSTQLGEDISTEGIVEFNVTDEGHLSALVFNAFGQQRLAERSAIMTLTVRAKRSTQLSDAFQLLDGKTEVIDNQLNTAIVAWELISGQLSANTVSISPNPFSRIATMTIISDIQDNSAKLVIYDNTGRLITEQAITVSKGVNEVQLDKTRFGLQTGVHYVDVHLGGAVINNKILIVE